ncbi:MAG: hypothetical protein HYZ58_18610, partial [Acidobacteria bacterium]|nr:hypothetical protein [Acidobacteriota bacterium]
MMRLTYDPELVEEAVLLSEAQGSPRSSGQAGLRAQAQGAVPAASRADARAFRRERDRVYDMADPDRREAAFHALHLRWFARLGLHEIVGQVVADHRDVVDRVDEGRVLRAVTRREEGADLVDQIVPGEVDQRPILVLRLRPRTLLEPEALRALLRHELMHVADMLDPAFGYQRSLPLSDDGPSGDNIVRDRYRVLWDVTIDGRLARASPCDIRLEPDPTRDARWQEFAGTFSMLGDDCRRAFEEWFDQRHPTHARLVEFALAPMGSGVAGAHAGRCPFCRFPVASLDPRPD